MSLEGQRIQPGRYTVVPRTLSFLKWSGKLLLIRVAHDRGAWAGKLNGIGGHVEAGEDPTSAARREIEEEAGVRPDALRLCGVVTIDRGAPPGIALYIFVGEGWQGELAGGEEGEPELVPLSDLEGAPLVEDLPLLLPKAFEAYDSGRPFSASYTYSESGALRVSFAP